jgi:hypothetical protein
MFILVAYRADLQKDNVPYDAAAGYRLARYNDPGTWPQFRRNEVSD